MDVDAELDEVDSPDHQEDGKVLAISELAYYAAALPWKKDEDLEQNLIFHKKVEDVFRRLELPVHEFYFADFQDDSNANHSCVNGTCFLRREIKDYPKVLCHQGRIVHRPPVKKKRHISTSSVSSTLSSISLPKSAKSNLEEGFLTPRKVAKNPPDPVIESIKTQNKFAALNPEDNENNKTSSNENIKIPPILVKIPINFTDFIKKLNSKLDVPINAKLSGELLKLQPQSQKDRKAIAEFCTENKAKFILTKTAEEKPLKIVIRGLDVNTHPNDISDELNSLGFPVLKVNQMHKGAEKIPIPLFEVHLINNEKANSIFKIKHLLYVTINVVNYKNNRTIECFNCQKFGHVASNCLSSPKCLICAGPHPFKECDQDKKANPKCTNCQGPHTSNSKNCPRFPKLNKIPPKSSTLNMQNKSYAEIVTGNVKTNVNSNINSNSSLSNTNTDINTKIENRKENTYNESANANNSEENFKAFINLATSPNFSNFMENISKLINLFNSPQFKIFMNLFSNSSCMSI